MPERIHFHFITVVWGDAYVGSYLDVVVPNNLSPGNLPALRSRARSVYRIYTSPRDAARIEASPAFARLSRVLRTEVVAFADLDFTQPKHLVCSEVHRRAVQAAEDDGAALVFLSPDLLWGDGSFARVEEVAAAGKRLLAVTGLRVVKETFVPEFLRAYYRPDAGTAPVGARDLVRLSLRHLHPITQGHLWDSAAFHAWAALLLWRVGEEGILGRCFHLHPLLINPSRRGIMPAGGTIDADYIWEACPDPADVHVVEDSDEIFLSDISAASQVLGDEQPNTARVEDVAAFARQHTNAQHRRFLGHRLRIHAGPLSPAWAEAERVSDEVVEGVRRLLAAPPPLAPPPEAAPPPPGPAARHRPAAPAPPGWRRFLSPSFLARKLREKGLAGCLTAGVRRIARRVGA